MNISKYFREKDTLLPKINMQLLSVITFTFFIVAIAIQFIYRGMFVHFQVVILAGCLLLFMWTVVKPIVSVTAILVLIFVPLSLGMFVNIPELSVAELMIVLITLSYFLPKIIRRDKMVVFKNSANPLLIPVLLFFVVVFLNYFRNPLPPANLLGMGLELGGLRIYYMFILCFCVYFLFADAVSRSEHNLSSIFRGLWITVLILNIYGIASVYMSILQDNFILLHDIGIVTHHSLVTGSWMVRALETGGYRLGLLQTVSPVALLVLLSGVIKIKKFYPILFVLFWFGLMLSGGRSFFIGMVVAFCMWIVIIKRNWKLTLVILLLAIGFYFAVFVYYDVLPGPLHRILAIRGGLEQTMAWRAELFPLFIGSFIKHPLFGVGIGSVPIKGTGFELFISQQLRFGGHGTYLSLLYTMGLIGFIPFVWILYRGIKISAVIMSSKNGLFFKSSAMFTLLFIIYYIFPMIVGGRGSDIFLFIILGIISGLHVVRKNTNNKYVST
jgi:O-antigen ligase